MRILIVSQYFRPEPLRITDAAHWLVEKGHEVTVLTGQPNYPSGRLYKGYGLFRPGRECVDGMDVFRVPIWPRGKGCPAGLALNYASFMASASLLGFLRVRGGYDVMLGFLPSPATSAVPAVLLRACKGIPLMLWVQDLWPESVADAGRVRSPLVLGALDRLVGFIYRHADLVAIQSRAFREGVARYGIPQDRIVYLPNTAEAFYGARAGRDSGGEGRSARPFTILYAGNIGEAQGLETVLSAIELIPPDAGISWRFLGDGRRRGWLAAEVARRGLTSVELEDRVPAEEMPVRLARADALLVTLRGTALFAATIPSKLQSVLASGRPVLAALDGEGARIVRESGSGVVAPPGNADALARCALELASMDRATLRAIGQAGRAYHLANFDRDIVYADLIRHLARLARRGPDARAAGEAS